MITWFLHPPVLFRLYRATLSSIVYYKETGNEFIKSLGNMSCKQFIPANSFIPANILLTIYRYITSIKRIIRVSIKVSVLIRVSFHTVVEFVKKTPLEIVFVSRLVDIFRRFNKFVPSLLTDTLFQSIAISDHCPQKARQSHCKTMRAQHLESRLLPFLVGPEGKYFQSHKQPSTYVLWQFRRPRAISETSGNFGDLGQFRRPRAILETSGNFGDLRQLRRPRANIFPNTDLPTE